MEVLKRVCITLFFAVFAIANMQGQDKMAKIVPTDVRSKVDTLILKDLRKIEKGTVHPSNDLYGGSWDNSRAHVTVVIPDSFTINLRHFTMPAPSKMVTSHYGKRWGRMHKGVDVKVYIGDTIVSAFDGKVRRVANDPNGYGLFVVIRHSNGLETVYGHLSKQIVVENQRVKSGQPIGLGGNTGRSTGSHLHFETRLCGAALNPELLFDFVHQDVTGDTYVFRKESMTLRNEVAKH